jgi:TFIIF-interacting CTD phosphatase-like protein
MLPIIEYIIHQVISLGPSSKGKLVSNKEELQIQSKDTNSTINKQLSLHKTILPPPNLKRKTLILDLDETLVHSTIKAVTHHHITVDVLIDGMTCTFYVIKRPHVDLFLKKVWFVVIDVATVVNML